MRSLGKLPRSREDLNIENLLENMGESGGGNIKVLDSAKLWREEDFRAIFRDVDGFADDVAPDRVVVFTTDALLSQLALSAKWSQVKNLLTSLQLQRLNRCLQRLTAKIGTQNDHDHLVSPSSF